MKHVAFIVFLLLITGSLQAQEEYEGHNYVSLPEGDAIDAIVKKAAHITPSKRQLQWQRLEKTAFIHFGINTFTDSEWGTGDEDPELFNPEKLDAEQWVKTLKTAGFKQVILTAKHHDGFCLWPSKYTGHSVKNSPWKDGNGDVVQEVADAAEKYDMGFGIYLSPWDMNYPDYGDTEKYNQYFENQLEELLTNYGQIDEVWFDGANGADSMDEVPDYHFDSWYNLIRKLQPQAVIAVMGPDVRWVGTETGYGRDSEWSVVPAGKSAQDEIAQHSQQNLTFKPEGDMTGEDLGSRDKIKNAEALIWYPAEADVSIRPGWFYHEKEDSLVKSTAELRDIYYNSVGKNATLLLNLPPNKEGLLDEHDVDTLNKWGEQLKGTFKENLAKDAKITSKNGIHPKNMLDGDVETYWTTKGKDSTAEIVFELDSPKTFDVLGLQEAIKVGQRIEGFKLEYREGSTWKKITEGTTVGYKRLLRFDPVTAQKVRLTIKKSRLNPTLKTFGLYKQA